jgi:hypothetical protein
MSISADDIRHRAIRAKLVLYQKDAVRMLRAHFFGPPTEVGIG